MSLAAPIVLAALALGALAVAAAVGIIISRRGRD